MFEKLFNTISIVFGLIGGYICSFIGGYDIILKALVTLVVLDYVTGLLKALSNKTLSSEVGFRGILKKITIFIVVGTAVVVQKVAGDAIPLREITIVFYICNEGISLLENASEFVPLPDKLKTTLIQLRDNNEGDDENEDKQ